MNLKTLLACVLLSAIGAQPALAYCSPELDYTVKGEFRRSDIVATARVESVSWLNEKRQPTKLAGPLALGNMPGGFDPYIGAYYTVRLIKTYKGNPPHRFRIFSENTEARTPLRIGPSLLLFITRVTKSDEYARAGDLTVDYCGNSLSASRANKALRLIGRLSQRR